MIDKRLTLVVAFALNVFFTPLASEAQQRGQLPRIGYLGTTSASLEPELLKAFREGLRDLGYVEGQNIVIEYRWAEGNYRRFPDLVADLLSLKVDLIVTAGTPSALAAKRATKTTPIVMAVTGDAVGAGLVSSLARPGGNLTGLTTMIPELEGKRLELLREVLPKLTTIAVLLNTANPFVAIAWTQTQVSAQALGLTVQPVELRGPKELEDAFAKVARQRPSAITMVADRFLLAHRTQIVDFVAKERLPAIYPYREFVFAGGLMSYSPSYEDLFRRSAAYVDKILKGAKPGDLPVEQPTKFELLVSTKTAKTLGLTIPPSLLLRADHVVE
ncbi:MAG: ABC transporter substrate-binding protein [Candidatus Rokubacteria bacterium]|nr:ABC transporter substrate-binding protein [Candidatus Rokubacteria bacterium]